MQELEVALAVTQALDALGVSYCIGGSFASTVHGEARLTRDVDVLTALRAPHIQPFVRALEATFFIQRQEVQQAIALAPTLQQTPHQRASFSMLHQPSFFKADIFVSSGRQFDVSQFARRVAIAVAPNRHLQLPAPRIPSWPS
jgi:poly(3-hydroxyalkanoate) synthetase